MSVKFFMQVLNLFDSVTALRKFVDENQLMSETVFDFDWSNCDDDNLKNILICISSAEISQSKRHKGDKTAIVDSIIKTMSTHVEFSQFLRDTREDHGEFIDIMLQKIVKAFDSSWKCPRLSSMAAHRFSRNYFHPSMMLLNHSCDPNVFTTIVDDNKIAWIANRPIKAGQQLFISYTPEFYSDDVPIDKNYCNFKNSCVPCQYSWKKSLDPKIIAGCEKS